SSDSAYVTGQTASMDFPTTPGAFQTGLNAGSTDVFVTKLDANGTGLIYSTFLGGRGSDHASGIAVDGSGDAYVTGGTFSSDFPMTLGAYQTSFGGGNEKSFVT